MIKKRTSLIKKLEEKTKERDNIAKKWIRNKALAKLSDEKQKIIDDIIEVSKELERENTIYLIGLNEIQIEHYKKNEELYQSDIAIKD